MASGNVTNTVCHSDNNKTKRKCSGQISAPMLTTSDHSGTASYKYERKCSDKLGNIFP